MTENSKADTVRQPMASMSLRLLGFGFIDNTVWATVLILGGLGVKRYAHLLRKGEAKLK